MTSDILLDVQDLSIAFDTEKGRFRAVDGVSFQVKKGKTLAIVGESGCGKSVTSLSIMGLLPSLGSIDSGKIIFDGQDLAQKSPAEIRKMCGSEIAMIFQEPMTALNPVYTVGQQVSEVFRIHKGYNRRDAMQASIKMLEKVRIPDPHRRINEYPFQMSGGMRQRVLIAIALAANPKLLIADEPTTALDVTIQLQILELMAQLQEEMGTSIVLITHDLGVVAEVADDVTVMYAGKAIETGSVYQIFDNPSHPYTRGLLKSIPKWTDTRESKLATIEGLVPNIFNQPKGCRFNNRCDIATTECLSDLPSLSQIKGQHLAACHNLEKEQADV